MKASGRASTGVKRALSRQQSGGVREDIRLYAGIAHQLHVGIAIWHLENLEDPKTFHLIFANPAAERYLSVPSETVYGKTMAGIFPDFFLTLTSPKSFRKSLFQVRPRTSVKSGTVTKKCPTAFSQREFTLCRIIVFALHLRTLLSR